MNTQLAKAIATAIASASLLAPLYATAQTAGTAPAGAAPGAATGAATTPAPAMSSVQRRAADGNDSVHRADRRFVEEAARSDMAEIATSKVALQKSSNDSVKKFAQHMIDEHTKTSEQLKPMAQAKGIELPTAPDRAHQRMLDKLEKESGDKFDREYMRGQVKDHEKAVRLFERQAKNGRDNELKQFASTTLPNLREHLKMAKDGQQAHMGGDRHRDRNSTSSTSMSQGGAGGASGATAGGSGTMGTAPAGSGGATTGK